MTAKRIDYALTPAQRVDARAALQLLDGTGISLEEAARRAIAGKRAVRQVTVDEAIDLFVRSRLTGGLRERTVEWYQDKLRLLQVKFGTARLDAVQRAEFVAWLKALPCSAAQRATITRAARALWRWAAAEEPQLVGSDITTGLDTRGPQRTTEVEFLTVAEVRAIMQAAGPYRSALALLLFAGIRPEELAGRAKSPLLWKHVRSGERILRIPAEISKTGRARSVEDLPAALWSWLEPRDDEVPVSPGRTRQALERAQAAIKRAEWPHDATRHTFATYAFALMQNAGKVAYWLGHEGNPTMLHRHYRGLTTKAEAEKFFALRPEKK